MANVKRPNWPRLWYGFVRSNYITAVWNWFMMLAGKASEPVLFGSVLYSGYQLVPGVPQPTPGLNAIAFVTQQAALDIGGMGLIKLTKDESPEKFKFARWTGIALITLMVVNMIVATANRVFPVPAQIIQITEGILLIIRSVMAVLFGHAIHTLKESKPEQDIDVEIDEIVNQAVQSEVQHLRTFYESRIGDLEQSLSSLKGEFLASQESISEETLEPAVVYEELQSEEVSQSQNSVVPSGPASPLPVQKNTTAKVQTSDAAKRVQKLLKKQPNLTAKQIAEKAEISESYAQKLKAQIAKGTAEKPTNSGPLPADKPEPIAQNANVLKPTNGHRKDTQPLANLVELEV